MTYNMAEIKRNVENRGRPKNVPNKNTYKWKVIMFDRQTEQLKIGKFFSIPHLNDEWDLKLNSDYVRRIMSKYRVDEDRKKKENSFLARWGHITIEKINEKI